MSGTQATTDQPFTLPADFKLPADDAAGADTATPTAPQAPPPTPATAPVSALPANATAGQDQPFTLPADFDLQAAVAPPGTKGSLLSRVAGDVAGGAKEAIPQVLRGAEQALNETSKTLVDATAPAADWLNSHVVDLGVLQPFKGGSLNPLDWWSSSAKAGPEKAPAIPDAVIPAAAQTVTGGLVEGASQFAVGMGLAGRYLKAFGLGGEAAGLAGAAKTVAKGGIAAATAFDPHEDRLSNMVQAFPALANPVTDFLSSHPDDGEAMGRLKAGLEGLGLGAATEGFAQSIKALGLMRAGKPEEAAQAAHEADPKVQSTSPTGASLATDADPAPQDGAQPTAADDTPAGPGPGADPAGKPQEGPSTAPEGNPTGDAAQAAGDTSKPGTAAPARDPAGQTASIINLTMDDLSSIRERAGVLGNSYGPDEQGVFFKPLSGINTDYIQHDGDLKATLDSLTMQYQDAMKGAIGGDENGVRSFAQVRQDADDLADAAGADPHLFIQQMADTHSTVFGLDAKLRAHADFMATLHDNIGKIADVIDGAAEPASMGFKDHGEAAVQFARNFQLLAETTAYYRGEQTNVARALNAFKMGGKVNPQLSQMLSEGIGEGPENLAAMARRYRFIKNNPAAGGAVTRPGFVRRFMDAGNEYWINAILSGPKTHAANIIGNTLSTALMPVEKMTAGAIRMVTEGQRQDFTEGALHLWGLMSSVNDAIKLAARAYKVSDSILTPKATKFEAGMGPDDRAITASNLGISSNSNAANLVNGLGSVVRFPSRMLTTEDEFFKQLTYRAAIRAQAMRQALDAGLTPFDRDKWGATIAEALDKAATATGQGTNEAALELAKQATFQQDLASSTWASAKTLGETLQDTANNHPMLKVILPFVKTPTNLLRFAWERTPGLNLARRQYFEDISGAHGPQARSEAWAKMATGGALWSSAIYKAQSGQITGAGPADPNARKALQATGWQPYSFKVENKDGSSSYYGYDRLDPFGMFFGLAADYAEVASAHPEQTQADMAVSMMQALAKNLNNKTYLSGMVQALSSFSDPERKGQSYVRSVMGSFIPAAMAQALRDDPYMREARTLVDGLRARTPGFSETLDPQRNILGQPIARTSALGPDWLSPIASSTHGAGDQPPSKDWKGHVQGNARDEIARQLYLHGTGLSPLPQKHGQLDLTQATSPVTGKTAYDRWQELTGTVQMGGKTLEQRLDQLVQTSAYRTSLTDSDLTGTGSRLDMIRSYLSAYREMAKLELFREQPELGRAFMAQDTMQALRKVQQTGR